MREAARFASSLGDAERDTFWTPADAGWPIYWWDSSRWVCSPTLTAWGNRICARLEDGRVRRASGFVEYVTPGAHF